MGSVAAQISLSKITAALIGKPYEEVSCIGLLDRVYREHLGIDVPQEWEGMTVGNFRERFEADRTKTICSMLRLIRSVGRGVSTRDPRIFDLLVLKANVLFPAVYIGGGKAMTSLIGGEVCVCLANGFGVRCLLARRLIDG